MTSPIATAILQELSRLPEPLQRQVLDFARSLQVPDASHLAGRNLLKFAGTIPSENLAEIQDIISNDCRQIDVNNR